MHLILLAVGRVAQEPVLELLDGQGLIEAEMATSSSETAAEPGRGTKGKACDASEAQIGVFREVHTNVEEDLLDARNGQLWLDLGRRRRDFADSLEDRSARRDNVIASDCLVPVSAVLLPKLIC